METPCFSLGRNCGSGFRKVQVMDIGPYTVRLRSKTSYIFKQLKETTYIKVVKLTAKIKLNPTAEQVKMLLTTLEEANAVCNDLSAYAFDKKVFRQFDLHKAKYHPVKETTRLSAQVIIRCISKVSDAYKLDKEIQRAFRRYGAIAYDSRILSYKSDSVSVWTVEGRQKIPFRAGEHQKRMLKHQKGESDLVYVKGKFYLLATCDIPDTEEETFSDVLGVDLGIVNLATDSDGQTFSGEQVEKVRQRHARLKAGLQSCGTKSAKRHLKKLSGMQKRFQKDVNHCISKRLVLKAKGTQRAIAMEDLTHMRKRTEKRLRKAQRSKHSNWSFFQLRSFIAYKARQQGVTVRLVNPAYTSQRCHCCGHTEKANRKSQSVFACVECGHTANADQNGALNIKLLGAAINQPIVSIRLAG